MHWKSVTSHRVGIDLCVQAQLLATHPVFNWEGVRQEMVTGLESSIGIGMYRSARQPRSSNIRASYKQQTKSC